MILCSTSSLSSKPLVSSHCFGAGPNFRKPSNDRPFLRARRVITLVVDKNPMRNFFFREMTKKHNRKASNPLLVRKDSMKQDRSASSKQPNSVRNQLDGARFRWLNESLYTESSEKSFELFQSDPTLFEAYHSGFRSQASVWPLSPVDECFSYISANFKSGSVIGDFGCGDAKLAQKLNGTMSVHSFDLISVNPLVTACNISAVPLDKGSLDFAVFSLSLMGTDWPKFVSEAHRCLRPKGILYIAEVQSRVADFSSFVNSFKPAFEVVVTENKKDKYFVKVILRKVGNAPILAQDPSLLKPCFYKKR